MKIFAIITVCDVDHVLLEISNVIIKRSVATSGFAVYQSQCMQILTFTVVSHILDRIFFRSGIVFYELTKKVFFLTKIKPGFRFMKNLTKSPIINGVKVLGFWGFVRVRHKHLKRHKKYASRHL